MKLSISKAANPNYLARVITLKNIVKHPNADKLQMVSVDFNNIITGMDAKEGDTYVYFPLECQINNQFLVDTNSFSSQLLNKDTTVKGYFDKNGRVRATKLRGEKSMGYVVPVGAVEEFTKCSITNEVGEDFDTIGDVLMCKKYELPIKGMPGDRIGKKPKVSRLIDGQVHLHVDTEQLAKNIYKINPEDNITITYKVHGTSGWVSHVLVKRKLNILEKILKAVGVKIEDKEYDYIYGSRKIVKNANMRESMSNFYDCDIWAEIKDDMKEIIPTGYTIYYEAVGFTKSGGAIQSKYDYGCEQGKRKVFVYRITITNAGGQVVDLSSDQCLEFCARHGLTFVPVLFKGKAREVIALPARINREEFNVATGDTVDYWRGLLMKELIAKYTDKDCYICKNVVPEEGMVLRKEGLFSFEAFKLKSWRFLELETELLDNNISNIEDDQNI